MQNKRSTIIIVAVLVVLVGVVVALAMTRSNDRIVPNENDNLTDTGTSGGDEANSIIVNNQIPGDVVFYNNLTMNKDGFIIVRDDKNGKPGDVIGVKPIEAGSVTGGNVELDRSTVEGGKYYVELYTDTNNNGKFDEGVDKPVVTSSGKNVRVLITTTEDLPEVKG